MIISASRRTDIPAFYSKWFMNRIEEGWFCSVNPFNPTQRKRISLAPADVDVIVFWSKNPRPVIKYLNLLDEKGFRYYFQFTINDYPAFLEAGLPALNERLDTFRELSGMIGHSKVIWRYDPVIVSNLTPVEYHIEKFSYIVGELSGNCTRAIISFFDFYRKLGGVWKRLEKDIGFKSIDIVLPEYSGEMDRLISGISRAAGLNGMDLYTCSETYDLSGYGVKHGRCIDAGLINSIFDLDLPVKKDINQRKGCLCAESTDMGAYNTCGHGCMYCYANRGVTAERNSKNHDTQRPFL